MQNQVAKAIIYFLIIITAREASTCGHRNWHEDLARGLLAVQVFLNLVAWMLTMQKNSYSILPADCRAKPSTEIQLNKNFVGVEDLWLFNEAQLKRG